MQRFIGLDAYGQSCTLCVMGPGLEPRSCTQPQHLDEEATEGIARLKPKGVDGGEVRMLAAADSRGSLPWIASSMADTSSSPTSSKMSIGKMPFGQPVHWRRR